MKYVALIFSSLLLLTGCETTGDPHHGGIFWSEDKAQQRLDQKNRELHHIQSDTERVEEENRELKKKSDDDDQG
jgi:poly(3-hydroxybutyrate) depolymerase